MSCRLVERQLVHRLPTGPGLRQDFAHLGHRFGIHALQLMRSGGRPVRHRATPFDEHATCLNGVAVDLRSERAPDGADMGTGLEPLTAEYGLAGIGAAGDDVRAPNSLLEGFHGAGSWVARGQLLRAREVA